VGKANGSRECAPDDKLRVPTKVWITNERWARREGRLCPPSGCFQPVAFEPVCPRRFRVDGATVFPILNLRWHDDTYSKGLSGLIRDFVGRSTSFRRKTPGSGTTSSPG